MNAAASAELEQFVLQPVFRHAGFAHQLAHLVQQTLWTAEADLHADPRPQMRRFPGNVLVLQGQCDFVPYAEAYEYVELFPNARYRFVAGAGHILWWEQPETYAQAIKAFLAEDDLAP